MRTKCAMCGELEEICFHFKRITGVWGFKLYYCYDCGRKIQDWLKEQESKE